MSGVEAIVYLLAGAACTALAQLAIRRYRKAPTDHLKPPHVPPITATWPARNIGVNGFRYVLDKEQGR